MIVLYSNEKVKKYPGRESCFSPSMHYPEYIWEDFSETENSVYDMVRNVFITAGLDAIHQGKKSWNPLGTYIKPGNKVLIKPNWVENKNKYAGLDDELSCLVTNPSIVRAVIDYSIIVMMGTGQIYIADAPMQGCDLQNLFSKVGYNELFEYYKSKGVSIKVVDLRKYCVVDKYNGVFSKPIMTKESFGSRNVNLCSRSLHSEKDELFPKYKVEDYPIQSTNNYHSNGDHIYEVNSLPLNMDVIINLPKPKTHRLAGLTGACKNFVGITYEKACLPHRIDGDAEKGKGDAYYKHSIFKQLMSRCNEKRTEYSRKGQYTTSKIFDFLMKSCYLVGAVVSGDKYRIGSWYGNDTIWRTAIDLNTVMMYADATGKVKETKQRTIIHLGDMIISGEKEGPVGPTPKPLGIIVFSDNALAFDRTVCEIMGFNEGAFPMFSNEKALKAFGYEEKNQLETEIIKSNREDIDCKMIKDFPRIREWSFEPHPCWKGHIEK